MKTPIQIAFILLLAASLACSVPSIGLQDQNAISTSAAETVIAGLTQNAPLFTPTAEISLTPTATFPTETPTITPTATETQTPFQIFTATSTIVLMSVSTPTNCRNGPGKVYNRVGAIVTDQQAEVVGKTADGEYWYIRNPDHPSDFCWAWGEYATLTGPVQLLPVFTPPPTPTPTLTATPEPNFSAEFTKLDECVGWWVEIRLKNTGPIAFKSTKLEVKDNVTDVELVSLSDGFTDNDGCLKTTTKDTLSPGDEFTISGPAFTANPKDHNMRVFVTLCSQLGQKGVCVTKKINFKP